MVTTATKIKAFRAIVNGDSLTKVAKDNDVTTNTIKSWMHRIFWRGARLEPSYKDIKNNPKPYLDYVKKLEEDPTLHLSKNLGRKLSIIPDKNITPQYLSNLTASMLLNKGLNIFNINELQEWLSKSNLSLKPELPRSEGDFKHVREAVTILEAYHFDAKSVREQLNNLLSEDDD